jgi:hypothetical protein
MDAAVALVHQGGFRRVRLRGDTDFSLIAHFDRWTEAGVEFVLGMDEHRKVVALADGVAEKEFAPLSRSPRAAADRPRRRPENVKQIIVHERGYEKLILEEEHVVEVLPAAPVPAHVSADHRAQEDPRRAGTAASLRPSPLPVLHHQCSRPAASRRCRTPSDGLGSNWAYAVIASLAWNLKVWLSIVLPHRHKAELRRMEYRRFLHSVMLVPCQVVRTARRLVLRLLAYTPCAELLLDGMQHFRRRRLA